MKDYISKQIGERGLDENKQILIDFSGENVMDEEIMEAAKELGYLAESAFKDTTDEFRFGVPYGYWWIYKEQVNSLTSR